jgi:hypothetical protein
VADTVVVLGVVTIGVLGVLWGIVAGVDIIIYYN